MGNNNDQEGLLENRKDYETKSPYFVRRFTNSSTQNSKMGSFTGRQLLKPKENQTPHLLISTAEKAEKLIARTKNENKIFFIVSEVSLNFLHEILQILKIYENPRNAFHHLFSPHSPHHRTTIIHVDSGS